MSNKKDDIETLSTALPREIERCQELLEQYAEIPTGAFGHMMIKKDIHDALKAMAEQDLPEMISNQIHYVSEGCTITKVEKE